MADHQLRRQARNAEIVADIIKAAGAVAPIDPALLVKRKAAEISTAMALIHGGEWQVQIDHSIPLVLVRRT